MTRATPPRVANVSVAKSRLPHHPAGGEELAVVHRPRTRSEAESVQAPQGGGGRTHPTEATPGLLELRPQQPQRPESERPVFGSPAGPSRRRNAARERPAVRRRSTSAGEQHHLLHTRITAC